MQSGHGRPPLSCVREKRKARTRKSGAAAIIDAMRELTMAPGFQDLDWVISEISSAVIAMVGFCSESALRWSTTSSCYGINGWRSVARLGCSSAG